MQPADPPKIDRRVVPILLDLALRPTVPGVRFSDDGTHMLLRIEAPTAENARQQDMALGAALTEIFGSSLPGTRRPSQYSDSKWEYALRPDEVTRMVPETRHPLLHALYEEAVRIHAIKKECAQQHGNARDWLWARVLSGERGGSGPYFPVEELQKLFRNSAETSGLIKNTLNITYGGTYSGPPEGVYVVMNSPDPQADAFAQTAIDAFRALGAPRIAFAGKGKQSLFFRTTPNREGRQQLIGLANPDDKRVDCPLVLPEIESHTITHGNYSACLRVMPGLETGDAAVTHRDELQLETLLARMRLPFGDLDKLNIGILHFTGNDGSQKRVPLILDWGIVCPPRDQPLPVLQKEWENIPELADWYEAQAYLRRQHEMEHTMQHGQRSMRLDLQNAGFETGDPRTLADAINHGNEARLYLPETAAIARETPEGETPFADRLREETAKRDLSQFQTPRPR